MPSRVLLISLYRTEQHFPRVTRDIRLRRTFFAAAMKWFRRKNEQSWEVVGCECIDPVPMIDDDDELDILRVRDTATCGTYIFDLGKRSPQGSDYCNAVLFARQQLLQEIVKNNWNILLSESWTLILYRKGKSHRIEVQYAGRPAYYVSDKAPPFRPPPFMAVLESQHLFS